MVFSGLPSIKLLILMMRCSVRTTRITNYIRPAVTCCKKFTMMTMSSLARNGLRCLLAVTGVVALANGYGYVTVPVTILSEQVTAVHFEGGFQSTNQEDKKGDNLVRLPGGEIAWLARHKVSYPPITETGSKVKGS